MHAKRIKIQHGRPFVLFTGNFLIPSEIINKVGRSSQPKIRNLIFDIIQQNVYETDTITLHNYQLLWLLPETSIDDAQSALTRVNERIADTLGYEAEIGIHNVNDEQLSQLIDKFSGSQLG